MWGGEKERRKERRKEEMATAERYFLSQRRWLWGWSDGGRDMRRWEGVEVRGSSLAHGEILWNFAG